MEAAVFAHDRTTRSTHHEMFGAHAIEGADATGLHLIVFGDGDEFRLTLG